jgi:hypothetical protein
MEETNEVSGEKMGRKENRFQTQKRSKIDMRIYAVDL